MSIITKKIMLFVLLTGLSYYLNTTAITLYYGVHLLFGSIPLIIILKKLGVWPAFIAAIMAQSYTILIWNHPYALLIFSLEILFVGFVFKNKHTNLIIRDALYWALIGVPLIFVSYGAILGFGMEGTLLVALKDMMNGLVNVLIAEIIYFLYVLLANRWSNAPSKHHYTMREVISYMGGGILLTLSFVLVLLIGFYEQNKDKSQLLIKTDDKLSEITRFYESWVELRIEDHGYWVQQAETVDDPESFREITNIESNDFSAVSILENGSSSLNGLQVMYPRIEGDTYLEIRSKVQFEGNESRILRSRYPLSFVENYILEPTEASKMTVSLISVQEALVFSNDPNFEINQDYQRREGYKVLTEYSEGRVITYNMDAAAMTQWKHSKFTQSSDVVSDTGAYFIVSTDFMPFIDYQLMNKALLIILSFVLLVLIIGEFVSRKLLYRFESLSEQTSRVVEALPNIETDIHFPNSMIDEFETLSNNFKVIIKEWQQKYLSAHQMNKELEEKKHELEQSRQRMEYMAHYDTLTNLPNRRQFNKNLQTYIDQDTLRLGLLFIDLDHFKSINDQFGHEAGDQFLRLIANELKKTVGKGEVYRLSGDEFTIIINNLVNPDVLLDISEGIINHFRKPLFVKGHKIYARMSIGIAVYPDQAADKDTLLRIADSAMYKSKRQGRNQVRG